MTPGHEHLDYRRLRAPRENGGSLIDPPKLEIEPIVRSNRRTLEAYCYDCQGRCLTKLSRQARSDLVKEARRWTSAYRDVQEPVSSGPETIFLAGHQPQLFHAGVWFKNFALGALTKHHRAVAINLLIDSDTVKGNSLRVPGGTVENPEAQAIPMDVSGPTVPYEQRRIIDSDLFAAFGRRVFERVSPLVADSLIREYWPSVVERSKETDNLGACLAQSRHQLEGRWGWNTLEIPQSRVCESPAHDWFVAHLLAQLPRFRQTYNRVVNEYRRAHRIRSAAHPVPNLRRSGEWLEAPFWIWSDEAPRRRPLFVKHLAGQTLLSNRDNLEIALPLTADQDADRAVGRLSELATKGIKLRSRALITTLWARLVLGDLFIHGIGGAKYDQVTDALITRFFGLAPPDFLVLSATLHLPIAAENPRPRHVRTIRQQLRELEFHPERYVNAQTLQNSDHAAAPIDLIADKTDWIRTPQTPENAGTRYREIRRINRELQPWVADSREQLLTELDQSAKSTKARAVISWREYAFCLFPEKTLRDFFDGLLPKIL
jgi:hypothetical protein